MNLKILSAATIAALSLMACDSDSSTSAPSDNNNQGNGSTITQQDNSSVLPNGGSTVQTNDESEATANAGIVCTGELNDNQWKATIKGVTQGVTIDANATVTFDGTTMTSENSSKIDMMTPDMCNTMVLFSSMGEEDDSEDLALYGPIVGKTEMSCEGSILSMKEKRAKENITAADREAAYNDMMVECKDYRDGRKSLDEFLDDEEDE